MVALPSYISINALLCTLFGSREFSYCTTWQEFKLIRLIFHYSSCELSCSSLQLFFICHFFHQWMNQTCCIPLKLDTILSFISGTLLEGPCINNKLFCFYDLHIERLLRILSSPRWPRISLLRLNRLLVLSNDAISWLFLSLATTWSRTYLNWMAS